MNTYRLARLVAILLFLAAALYFLGGLIVGISVWNRGLGAGWGSGFAGWLSIPIFIGTFFAALTLLMFGVVLYFLAAINDHLTAARLNKARSPVRPTSPPAPPAMSRTEPSRTASPFASSSAPAAYQPPSPPPPPPAAPTPAVTSSAAPPADVIPAELAAELPGTVDEDASAPAVDALPGAEEAARIASELR